MFPSRRKTAPTSKNGVSAPRGETRARPPRPAWERVPMQPHANVRTVQDALDAAGARVFPITLAELERLTGGTVTDVPEHRA